MNKEKILASLSQREGMPQGTVLEDILEDCMEDLKELLHVEELKDEHSSILKELVIIKGNREGTEGMSYLAWRIMTKIRNLLDIMDIIEKSG